MDQRSPKTANNRAGKDKEVEFLGRMIGVTLFIGVAMWLFVGYLLYRIVS